MLAQTTRFPQVGSYAVLAVPAEGPRGGTIGVNHRRVSIVQQRADGRLTVTAPAETRRIGNRRIELPSISKTVERRELREAMG